MSALERLALHGVAIETDDDGRYFVTVDGYLVSARWATRPPAVSAAEYAADIMERTADHERAATVDRLWIA